MRRTVTAAGDDLRLGPAAPPPPSTVRILGTEWNTGSRATVEGRLISLGGSIDTVRTTVNVPE